MIKINVISKQDNWKRFLKSPNLYMRDKIRKINKKNKSFKRKRIYCTLLLSDTKDIKKLNKKFRQKNKSTDVLSFPFYNKKDLVKVLKKEKEIYLGDIIININKIKYKKDKNKFKYKFNKLWIHGLLHLFGYDHKKNKDFYVMNKIERKFISYLH